MAVLQLGERQVAFCVALGGALVDLVFFGDRPVGHAIQVILPDGFWFLLHRRLRGEFLRRL